MEHTGDKDRPGGVTSGGPGRPPAAHAGALLTFDMRAELDQLRGEPTYASGDRNARTLLKEDRLRLVLLAIKAGGRLDEHAAPGPVTIHAIEGGARLLAAGETVELTAGRIVSLEANVRHAVEATEDTALLVTVAWPPGEHAEGSS